MSAAVLEFTISGVKYRANPMDARQQLHVVRRLSGLAAVMVPLAGLAGAGDDKTAALFAALPDLLSRLGDVMDAMSNDSLDYVINACLSVTQRAVEGDAGWAPVLSPNGMIMFDDIKNSLAALVQIVVPIIRRDITGFFSEFPKEAWGSLLAGKA